MSGTALQLYAPHPSTVNMGHGWVTRECDCLACGHEWIYVAPQYVWEMECPNCGYFGHYVMLGTGEAMPCGRDGPWVGEPFDTKHVTGGGEHVILTLS